MKKYIVAILALMLCVSEPLSFFTGSESAVHAAEHQMTQTIVTGPDMPSEDNAYILFRKTPVMHSMSFEDGVGTDRYSNVAYNEAVMFDGVEARQVWKENLLYMRLDPSFASPEDSVFKIEFDYWDYSGVGWLFLDYTTADSDTVYSRISILKEGDVEGAPKWHRVTVYITDASFRQAMPYGCDLVFVTNAFNSIAKIEITNISAKGGDSTEELGVFNSRQADALHYIGLYEGVGTDDEYDAGLAEFMTQEEMVAALYQGFGQEKAVLAEKKKPLVNDVSEACAPYVGYAERRGILADNFVPSARLTQADMLGYFARYLGFEDFDTSKPYESARACGFLAGNEAVFQMKKDVTRDNFIGVLASAVLAPDAGGHEPFLEMMERRLFTGADVAASGYTRWRDWILKRGFYNEPRKTVDPTTGRSWYSLDLLGEQATKAYFAQGLTSADGTRFYFTDKDSNIYEHNMETNITHYVDTCPYNRSAMNMNFVTTPQNNLWYINSSKEIIKMNCDTQEKVKVAEVPEWQKNYDVNMLFVSYDEKQASVTWRDKSGAFDSSTYGALPTLKLETGEWDISHYWSFDYGDKPASHNAINPYYNYQIFCHEYQPVYDRVWVVNMDTDEYYNVSDQNHWNQGILNGESAGHEYWCTCGKHACWVINSGWYGRRGSPSSMYSGSHAYCNLDGTDRTYVGTIKSNHASMSPDHRWIVGDDNENHGTKGHIVLTSMITGDSQILCYTPTMTNPGHAHPTFSWDGTKIFFGLAADDYSYAKIGWMDVSDIVNAPLPEGGTYQLSDACNTFGYEGYEYYLKEMSDAEGSYYHVPKGNKMYVKTHHSVTEDRNASIGVKVTYLDRGAADINIEYCKYERAGALNYLPKATAHIARKGTNKWITKEIIIDNVNMKNPFLLGADLLISGQLSSVDIRSVEVRAIK